MPARIEKFIDGERHKRCPTCEHWKPETDFYRCATKPDGRAAYCKPCSRAYTRKRAKLPRVKETRRKWAQGRGREVIARYQERNANKRKAQLTLQKAIEKGEIAKQDKCSICGRSERIEGHHEDYDYPLAVIWLCRWCHRMWHRKHGPGKNADAPVSV